MTVEQARHGKMLESVAIANDAKSSGQATLYGMILTPTAVFTTHFDLQDIPSHSVAIGSHHQIQVDLASQRNCY